MESTWVYCGCCGYLLFFVLQQFEIWLVSFHFYGLKSKVLSWKNFGLWSARPLPELMLTYFSEIFIHNSNNFIRSNTEMHLKITPAKCWPFCSDLNVFKLKWKSSEGRELIFKTWLPSVSTILKPKYFISIMLHSANMGTFYSGSPVVCSIR